MRSIALSTVLLFLVAATMSPALAVKFDDQNLEVGGEVLLHYFNGDFDHNDVSVHKNVQDGGSKYKKGDIETNHGGDRMTAENVYVWLKYHFDQNISVKAKMDFAEGDAGKAKRLEEAYVKFKEISPDLPLSVKIGKFEQPFVLDYDKGAIDPFSHTYEIDKVWGLAVGYELANIGKIEASLIDGDRIYDGFGGNGDGTSDAKNAKITDAWAARLTIDKAIENVKLEASIASRQDTPGFATPGDGQSHDNTTWSIGAVIDLAEYLDGFTLFGEYIRNERFDSTKNLAQNYESEDRIFVVGGDMKLDNGWRIIYTYNDYDDDNDGDTNFEKAHLIQVHKKLTKNVTMMLEYMKALAEDNVNVMEDQDVFDLAFKLKF